VQVLTGSCQRLAIGLAITEQVTPEGFDHGLLLAKETIREIPDEPHDPEIQPDLPPEPRPNLST